VRTRSASERARRACDCTAWLNQGTGLTINSPGVWRVGQRGGYLCDGRGGICDRSSHLSDCGGSICYWGSDFSYRRGKGSLVDDGVESVDGVSGVLDGTHCAVRLHQAVAALDDVSVAALLLALRIAGQSVLDVVSVAVLGVGVVVGVDGNGGGDLGDGGGIGERSGDLGVGGGGISHGGRSQSGSAVSQRSTGGYDGGGAEETRAGDGHQGGEDEELKMYGFIG